MRNVWRTKYFLGTFLSALLVTLSYEIKTPYLLTAYGFVIFPLAFIISTYMTDWVVNTLLQSAFGRMIIMSSSWIEGYWYLQTFASDDSPHVIGNDAITYMSYVGNFLELNVVSYRRKNNILQSGGSSMSLLATTRDFDGQFVNYFLFPEGTTETHGVTVGRFFSNGNSYFPNNFEGTSVLFSDGAYRRATARRIKNKTVKKLEREHGDAWREFILEKGYDYLDRLMNHPSLEAPVDIKEVEK